MMLDEEKKVFELLGKAFDEFILLPMLHHADLTDFVAAIHAAQNIILARPAMRELYKGDKVVQVYNKT